jgi:NTP pyrophosphatase (non-canonical NTP hydrolase)
MKFSERNRRRCESAMGFNHPLNSWSLSDWMTAVAGEVGEAANIIKKLNRIRDGIPGNNGEFEAELKQMLADEIADAAIYLDLLAQAAGFDLATIRDAKFEKTSRKIGYIEPEQREGHCGLCGLPMLPSESMFKMHGYSESCEQAKARIAAQPIAQ